MKNRKILLVDDEHDILEHLSAIIAEDGYEVTTAENGSQAWEYFQKSIYLVVVTDLKMPGLDGLEVLERIKKLHPATQVIILTGHGDEERAIKALNLDACHYIKKAGGSKAFNELLEAIEKAFIRAETRKKTEQEMLSFLTHTLRNSLSGGPQTVEQTLRLTKDILSERYQENKIYKAFNNIASLHTLFTSLDNMLNTYKLYVSETETINQKWQEDTDGTVRMHYLLSSVLRQTIGRIFFQEQYLEQFKQFVTKHAEKYTIKEIRESFIKTILLTDQTPGNAEQVFAWLNEYFPVISVSIEDLNIFFNVQGIRFNLLFACISEIVLNALKYADAMSKEPVQIAWKQEHEHVSFVCQNTFNLTNNASGTQKGLAFIKGLADMIDGIEFIYESKESVFTVQLQLLKFKHE